MLAMKCFFFLSLFLHSLVKTWPYYRSQAPAHHCCHNLIWERTLTLSESGFLIVLVKQSLKEGTQWLQRIFLRKWNKEEVRIPGNVTGYHGFHPEFWKSHITSKLCSEKNSCLVQRHENWYKTLVQSLWGKKRGPKLILLCCQIFPRHLLYVIGKKSDFFNPALHHCICSLKLNFSVSWLVSQHSKPKYLFL